MRIIIPNFSQYLDEMTNLPSKQWVDYDMKSLDAETMEVIWNMYVKTYGQEGLAFNAKNTDDLQQKYNSIFLMDVDKDKIPDAFIIYRKTPFGNKLALSGNNGSTSAKVAFIKKLTELMKTHGWYVEASKKIEKFMISIKAPIIDDEQIVRTVLNKDLNWLNNGYYERNISGIEGKVTKRMFGNPKI